METDHLIETCRETGIIGRIEINLATEIVIRIGTEKMRETDLATEISRVMGTGRMIGIREMMNISNMTEIRIETQHLLDPVVVLDVVLVVMILMIRMETIAVLRSGSQAEAEETVLLRREVLEDGQLKVQILEREKEIGIMAINLTSLH